MAKFEMIDLKFHKCLKLCFYWSKYSISIARVAAMETQLDNVGNSFDSICNAVHTTSPNTYCCVNGDNRKMSCELSALGAGFAGIDTTDATQCDRRAFGDPTINICGDNFN